MNDLGDRVRAWNGRAYRKGVVSEGIDKGYAI